MKKMLFIICCLMFMPMLVKADHIYNINILIQVERDGSAYILENWEVQADSGSSWCKKIYDLGNSDNLLEYGVHMDGTLLEFKDDWNSKASLKSNAGYYGISYTDKGMELCFGKKDYERHNYSISYAVKDYIFNTEDYQILYHVGLPKTTADQFRIEVIPMGYELKDDMELLKYGYNGNSYVEEDRIVFANVDGIKDQYAVSLIRFPLGTFETSYSKEEFVSYQDVVKDAEKFGYEYEPSRLIRNISKGVIWTLIVLVVVAVILGIAEIITRRVKGHSLFKKEKILEFLKKEDTEED